MSTWRSLGACLAMVLLLSACEGETPPITTQERQEADSIFTQMRRDEALGEGGWFAFTYGTEEFRTEWGYADFHIRASQEESRITLLSNPIGNTAFPLLRIVLFGPHRNLADYAGATVESRRAILKLEAQRGSGIPGAVSVTINAVEGEWIEGTFAGEISGDGEAARPIEGSFRARVNIPEELLAEPEPGS